jgi:hypothetical protein
VVALPAKVRLRAESKINVTVARKKMRVMFSEKAEVSFHTFDPPLVTPTLKPKTFLGVEAGKNARVLSRVICDCSWWRDGLCPVP